MVQAERPPPFRPALPHRGAGSFGTDSKAPQNLRRQPSARSGVPLTSPLTRHRGGQATLPLLSPEAAYAPVSSAAAPPHLRAAGIPRSRFRSSLVGIGAWSALG